MSYRQTQLLLCLLGAILCFSKELEPTCPCANGNGNRGIRDAGKNAGPPAVPRCHRSQLGYSCKVHRPGAALHWSFGDAPANPCTTASTLLGSEQGSLSEAMQGMKVFVLPQESTSSGPVLHFAAEVKPRKSKSFSLELSPLNASGLPSVWLAWDADQQLAHVAFPCVGPDCPATGENPLCHGSVTCLKYLAVVAGPASTTHMCFGLDVSSSGGAMSSSLVDDDDNDKVGEHDDPNDMDGDGENADSEDTSAVAAGGDSADQDADQHDPDRDQDLKDGDQDLRDHDQNQDQDQDHDQNPEDEREMRKLIETRVSSASNDQGVISNRMTNQGIVDDEASSVEIEEKDRFDPSQGEAYAEDDPDRILQEDQGDESSLLGVDDESSQSLRAPPALVRGPWVQAVFRWGSVTGEGQSRPSQLRTGSSSSVSHHDYIATSSVTNDPASAQAAASAGLRGGRDPPQAHSVSTANVTSEAHSDSKNWRDAGAAAASTAATATAAAASSVDLSPTNSTVYAFSYALSFSVSYSLAYSYAYSDIPVEHCAATTMEVDLCSGRMAGEWEACVAMMQMALAVVGWCWLLPLGVVAARRRHKLGSHPSASSWGLPPWLTWHRSLQLSGLLVVMGAALIQSQLVLPALAATSPGGRLPSWAHGWVLTSLVTAGAMWLQMLSISSFLAHSSLMAAAAAGEQLDSEVAASSEDDEDEGHMAKRGWASGLHRTYGIALLISGICNTLLGVPITAQVTQGCVMTLMMCALVPLAVVVAIDMWTARRPIRRHLQYTKLAMAPEAEMTSKL